MSASPATSATIRRVFAMGLPLRPTNTPLTVAMDCDFGCWPKPRHAAVTSSAMRRSDVGLILAPVFLRNVTVARYKLEAFGEQYITFRKGWGQPGCELQQSAVANRKVPIRNYSGRSPLYDVKTAKRQNGKTASAPGGVGC